MVDMIMTLAILVLMQIAGSMQGRQIGFLFKPGAVSNRNDMSRATYWPWLNSDVLVLCE